LLTGERGYVSGDAAMQQALSGQSKINYRHYAAAMIEISADAVTQID
jgi:hypothetical protein